MLWNSMLIFTYIHWTYVASSIPNQYISAVLLFLGFAHLFIISAVPSARIMINWFFPCFPSHSWYGLLFPFIVLHLILYYILVTISFIPCLFHPLFVLMDSLFFLIGQILPKILNFLSLLVESLVSGLGQICDFPIQLVLGCCELVFKFMLESEKCIVSSLGFVGNKLFATLYLPSLMYALPFNILEPSIQLLFPLFLVLFHELKIFPHLMQLLFK